jgi:transketolase
MNGFQRDLALKIRRDVLNMIHRSQSFHVGGCLSIPEILAVLYGGILRVDPRNPSWPDRDRFIVSKGHAAAACYAVLAESGFFPKDWLDTYYQNGTRLPGHVTYGIPGVEVSTGSLGHGLAVGCGMALAGKRDKKSYRVFVLLSDGECDEGSTWEAVLFAPHHKLDNLVAIVDYNKIQSFGIVKEVLDLEPFAEKWRAFGWAVSEIDGHDITQIQNALSTVPRELGRPTCIIAHTIKGKGFAAVENTLASHYRAPNDEELTLALAELR